MRHLIRHQPDRIRVRFIPSGLEDFVRRHGNKFVDIGVSLELSASRERLALRRQVSRHSAWEKVTRCTAAAGLDNASIGKDRWIGGYGTSLRGRPYRRPKNRGDGGYEAKTVTIAGRCIVHRNHQEAEKNGVDRA
jgi:hypothetical protein